MPGRAGNSHVAMVGEGKAGVNGDVNIEFRNRTSNVEVKRIVDFKRLEGWGKNPGFIWRNAWGLPPASGGHPSAWKLTDDLPGEACLRAL